MMDLMIFLETFLAINFILLQRSCTSTVHPALTTQWEKLPITNMLVHNNLTISVRSCRCLRLAFMNDFRGLAFDFLENGTVLWNCSEECKIVKNLSTNPLGCCQLRSLWFQWNDTAMSAGTENVVGQNTLITYFFQKSLRIRFLYMARCSNNSNVIENVNIISPYMYFSIAPNLTLNSQCMPAFSNATQDAAALTSVAQTDTNTPDTSWSTRAHESRPSQLQAATNKANEVNASVQKLGPRFTDSTDVEHPAITTSKDSSIAVKPSAISFEFSTNDQQLTSVENAKQPSIKFGSSSAQHTITIFKESTTAPNPATTRFKPSTTVQQFTASSFKESTPAERSSTRSSSTVSQTIKIFKDSTTEMKPATSTSSYSTNIQELTTTVLQNVITEHPETSSTGKIPSTSKHSDNTSWSLSSAASRSITTSSPKLLIYQRKLCACKCMKQFLRRSSTEAAAAAAAEELEKKAKREEIRKALIMPKESISAATHRRVSTGDSRESPRLIGVLVCTVCFLPFVLIVVMDIISLFNRN